MHVAQQAGRYQGTKDAPLAERYASPCESATAEQFAIVGRFDSVSTVCDHSVCLCHLLEPSPQHTRHANRDIVVVKGSELSNMHVVIVGGGLGGLSCAIGLRRHSIEATIVEKDAKLTEVRANGHHQHWH